MKIIKAKTSSYDSLTEKGLLLNIQDYAIEINDAILNGNLEGKNRTQLKAIAAELETITKRLKALGV